MYGRHASALVPILLAVFALSLAACSGSETDTGMVFDDAATDTGGWDGFTSEDAEEDTDNGDVGGDDTSDTSGEDTVDPDTGDCDTLGCPCEEDLDCASGYCIDARGGGSICSELCDGACSREGFDCLLLTNAEGDAVRICVESGDPYCEPCDIVADCGRLDAACIEIGGENACVTPCDASTRCPSGAECSTVMIEGEATDFCVPVADSCAPCLDEDEDGYGIGPDCLGPDPDDDDPTTYPGADELCDDVDNDGDGDIDEGFDFGSDPNNCGLCGVVCSTETTSGVCEEGRCVVESCTAGYDDCDGNPDNGCETDLSDPGLCGSCRVPSNLPGTPCGDCGGGTWTCEEGGWDVVCVGGEDDALNACGGCGILDGDPEAACGTCSSGVWTCSDDGSAVTCDGDLGDDATNACGGCTTLEAAVGDVCGPCDGAWACDGTDALTCEQDLTDSDDDGVCDPDDLCEGFDDSVDDDRDGIPNACDDTPIPDCFTAEDCDDGNVCTDERCVEGTCEITNNAVACDDGLFCNGVDTCADGVCGHTGSPCAEGALCDEAIDSCGACITDADCPDETVTAWSACGGYASPCDTTGTRTRTRTTYACSDSDCVPTETVETEACARETEGDSCAADAVGDWGVCAYDDLCDVAGERTREVTTYACVAEVCEPTVETQVDEASCVRDTAGLICDDPDFGAWSGCGGFGGACGEDGTRSRTVTRYTCGAGTCGGADSSESEACSRDTDGDSCGGPPEYTAWSACGGFEGVCDSGGIQTRVRTELVCGEGTCETVETLEERACSRGTDGETCGETTWTAWGSCGGYDSVCDTTGTQSRTRTEYTCAGDGCTPVTATETRPCNRSTDGASCGSDDLSAWSSCGGFADTCDESGTRSRTRTVYTCDAGSCGSSTSTESGACTRDTDGTTCDDTSATAWSACGSFSGTCDESGTQSRNVTTYTCGSGTCGGSTAPQTRACTRDTDGTGCGSSTYTAWSACGGYSDTCDNTGTQTRVRTDYTCAGASCSTSTTTESRSCSRNTNGTSCGSDSVGAWSSCGGYSGTCDESGSRTRSRTSYTCGAGTCQSSTTTESGSCSRDTDGTSCGSDSLGPWSSCGGYSNTCDETGTRSRTVTSYACTTGSCTTSTSTQTGSCSRDTDGTSCGSTTYGAWSACGGYTSTCDNTGTQTRTVTTYDCGTGTCRSSTTTESRSCSRNTNGTSCGSTSYGAWSSCSGYTTTCDETGSRSRSVTTYTCDAGACGSSSSTESGSCSRDTDGTWCTDFFECSIGTCTSGICESFDPGCAWDERCCEPGICAGRDEFCP